MKYWSDGTIERFEVRLVLIGYTKQESIDFTKIFSPVVKMTTVRTLIVVQ